MLATNIIKRNKNAIRRLYFSADVPALSQIFKNSPDKYFDAAIQMALDAQMESAIWLFYIAVRLEKTSEVKDIYRRYLRATAMTHNNRISHAL